MKIKYGDKEVEFELPESWNIVGVGKPMFERAVADLKKEINQAFNTPINSPPISALAKGKHCAVIVSDDATRPTPICLIISRLLNELNKSRIPDENIQIIIGRGTHRKLLKEELAEKFGKDTVDRVVIKNHEPDENLVDVGTTKRGTELAINKDFWKSEIKIGIGNVTPHFLAGFGGGPKVVLPGVSSRKSISQNHLMLLDDGVHLGKLDGNPVWEDILEAARMGGLDIKIDLLLNSEKEILKIYCGEVEEVHRRGANAVASIFGTQVNRKVDVCITSGFPLDIELSQAVKGAFVADIVTKDDGIIILMTPCYEGVRDEFYKGMKSTPYAGEFYQLMKSEKVDIPVGTLVCKLKSIVNKKRLILVTDLDRSMVEDMYLEYATSAEEAIEKARNQYEKADVAAFPFGAETLPIIRK